jgi:hypothetical protein
MIITQHTEKTKHQFSIQGKEIIINKEIIEMENTYIATRNLHVTVESVPSLERYCFHLNKFGCTRGSNLSPVSNICTIHCLNGTTNRLNKETNAYERKQASMHGRREVGSGGIAKIRKIAVTQVIASRFFPCDLHPEQFCKLRFAC